MRRWGVENFLDSKEATYDFGLFVRLPAVMWTARESRAVTCILVLAGLAASTDARQLVDRWARPGCRRPRSEIDAKDLFM